MTFLALSILILASTLALITILLLMKTAELQAAIAANTAAVNGLSDSVTAAVSVLQSQGASTPDSDIVPLLGTLDTNNQTLATLKAKLDAALTPPTT